MRPTAINRRSPWVLGLGGTLLLHALLLESMLLGAGTRHLPAARGALVLIQLPASTQNSDRRPIGEPPRPRFKINVLAPGVAMPIDLVRLDIEEQRVEDQPSSSVDDGDDFGQRCRRAYPDGAALTRDVAGVSLRDFVIRDGQINQGTIEISGGHAARARLALRCLQIFGTLGPTNIGQSPFTSQPR